MMRFVCTDAHLYRQKRESNTDTSHVTPRFGKSSCTAVRILHTEQPAVACLSNPHGGKLAAAKGGAEPKQVAAGKVRALAVREREGDKGAPGGYMGRLHGGYMAVTWRFMAGSEK